MTLKFEAKSADTHVAFIEKNVTNIWTGKRFKVTCAVRAKLEHNGWRVDFCNHVAGTWMPWEPITNTAYDTLALAKQAIEGYAIKESV